MFIFRAFSSGQDHAKQWQLEFRASWNSAFSQLLATR